MKTFKLLNDSGDIEVSSFVNPSAVFQDGLYSEVEELCTYNEIFNIYDLVSNCEKLQQENQQLKKELKSKPDAEITLQDDKGNKFMIIQTERIDMQEELNKIIQKLFNNWNELKNIIKDMASVGYIDKREGEYWATGWNSEYGVRAKILLSKMEELEQGSDSDE